MYSRDVLPERIYHVFPLSNLNRVLYKRNYMIFKKVKKFFFMTLIAFFRFKFEWDANLWLIYRKLFSTRFQNYHSVPNGLIKKKKKKKRRNKRKGTEFKLAWTIFITNNVENYIKWKGNEREKMKHFFHSK